MHMRYPRAALILALAAMMLRALLPMGWMPNPAGFWASPLVICTMDTPSGLDTSQVMDMVNMDMSNMDISSTTGHGHDHGQQSSEPCPFAAAPHIAAAGGLLALLAPTSLLARLAEKPTLQTGLALKRAYQPHSPRAPPSFA